MTITDEERHELVHDAMRLAFAAGILDEIGKFIPQAKGEAEKVQSVAHRLIELAYRGTR